MAGADPWQAVLDQDSDPDVDLDSDRLTLAGSDTGSGRYRGRRRQGRRGGGRTAKPDRRTARLGTAAVVAAVGVVLIGSGVLASYLSDPVSLPVVPPSPSPSPVPTLAASPPEGTSRLGLAPAPTATPTPVPAPPLSPAPVTPAPSPTSSPTVAEPSPPVSLSFEAEAAQLGGDAHVIALAAASGGEVVVVIGWRARHHVSFPAVTVDEAGEYELTLHYTVAPFLTDQTLSGRVRVNGGDRITVSFPGLPNGQTVGTVSVTVELAAGDNEVRFDNVGDWAPNLDRITITG